MSREMNRASNKKTILCPICKKITLANANFCEICRYPINVKKISGFNKNELSVQLGSILSVMTASRKALFNDKKIDEIYDELISFNWLRPESALWRFLEMRILLDLKRKYLKYPTLDLGCGEGVLTSILFGAKINKNYDAYESVDLTSSDVYNVRTKPPKDFLTKKSSPIGFGLDVKKNSVLKARDISTYDAVKVGDARKLPFENNSVNSIFSNMIDDIKREDLPVVFNEAHRVLNANGYFVFTTPNERFRKSLFYLNKAELFKKQGDAGNYKLFSMLDRGRSEWEPRPLSLWLKIFKQTRFKLISHFEYADETVLQLWDTGLRPFFKYLMDTRNILRKNDMLLNVKSIWVEIMKQWLWPYAKNKTSPKGTFSIIVAKKI